MNSIMKIITISKGGKKFEPKDIVDVVAYELPGKEIFKAMGAGNVDPTDLYHQLLKNFGMIETR